VQTLTRQSTRRPAGSALFTVALALLSLACSPDVSPEPAAGEFLFVWTTDADSVDLNFMAVVDADPASPRYGDVLTTLPVPTEGRIRGHHTEHRMPEGGVLFANDFGTGETYLIDLRDPMVPVLVDAFTNAGSLDSPHSFERFGDGSVLATFQTSGPGSTAPGGIARLDPQGRMLASSSAAPGGEGMRPYSLAIVPELDRVVTGSADMRGVVDSRAVQIWRASDLALLHTLDFPAEWGPAAEPRVLTDGRTVFVSTFGCTLLRVEGLETEEPTLSRAFDFGGEGCALPVVAGRFWIQAVPGVNGLVALDMSDPNEPVEAARLTLGPEDWPHWISLSPDGQRIVVTGYRGTRHRVLIVDLDPQSGRMEVDRSFGSPEDAEPGISFDRPEWPHGSTGPADPHGAVFSITPGG